MIQRITVSPQHSFPPSGTGSRNEELTAKNVQRGLAAKIQELSAAFRKKQRVYMESECRASYHTHLLPLSPNHPWCDLRLHRSSAHWSSWDSGIVLGQCTEAQRVVVRELVLQHLGLDIPTPKASIAKLFNHRTVSASLCHGSAFLSHKFLAPESKAKS